MKEIIDGYHPKNPGTQRRSVGVEQKKFGFVPEGRTYRVVCLEADGSECEPLGAERRVPPMQLDEQDRPVTRSWNKPRSQVSFYMPSRTKGGDWI